MARGLWISPTRSSYRGLTAARLCDLSASLMMSRLCLRRERMETSRRGGRVKRGILDEILRSTKCFFLFGTGRGLFILIFDIIVEVPI